MLSPSLLEQVLENLGMSDRPNANLAGLSELYGRWCRRIPFDNVQKRLFYSGPAEGPVPGHNSEDFFELWLTQGTGGTCWANSHAMHDLLEGLGFDVVRVAGTMLSTPDVVGPTHGSVVATVEDQRYLVDGSMHTERPVPIQAAELEDPQHPAERIRMEVREGLWHLLWRPAHQPEGLWCRIETIGVPAAQFNQYHERTRTRSPFNSALYIRQNFPTCVSTIAFGDRLTIGGDGGLTKIPLTQQETVQALVEEFGISEEVAASLPPDVPRADA